MNKKYEFPSRGFFIVADKVGETDFFLEKFDEAVSDNFYDEATYYFSAFLSAARSVTFALQAVMAGYPDFDQWYPSRQEKLRNSKLAKLYVDLRNHSQKVGDVPLHFSGIMRDGKIESYVQFEPTHKFNEVPVSDVRDASHVYLCIILEVIYECYQDYAVYVDPRALFTKEGLAVLGWTIEDVEEALGIPRGYTDIPWDGEDKDGERLKMLSRYGGDEEMEQYFEKYNIGDAS